MEGSKRRKRKNDRIDAHKLARLGRVDPQSLHPIKHRSTEVRQDLLVLRARDALVADKRSLGNALDSAPHHQRFNASEKSKEGRHVGLDFYDLLIEAGFTAT
jgi:hypothetical protein